MADSAVDTQADSTKAAAKPQAKADIDPQFEKQLKTLQKQADEEQKARVQGNQTKWMMPDKGDWSGDLFDFDGMGKPFDRSKSNDAFTEAIKSPASPGVNGDLIVTTLQVDYLACMERAFRSRHTMNRTRALAHMCGRKLGHGSNKGPLLQAPLEFLRGLVKESKANA